MSEEQEKSELVEPKRRKHAEGQVTLNQMLKALDKDVANGIEKRLKNLSKKKAVTAPLDEHKVAQIERKEAYEEVGKEVSKWDPIVRANRKAKHLQFPLDLEQDHLPTTADSLHIIKPRNEMEEEVQAIIEANKESLKEQKDLTKAEERYLKAISTEEAKERHQEMQKMRVRLSTYAAKMKRQKAIKSKSYRRLLKHERIKNHIQRVESNSDALLDEIERLQRLRAQERASLKHKNTGKWAKHAKFRAKYDEEARKAMLEQIGIAKKRLERPAVEDSDEDSEQDDEYYSKEEENSDDHDKAQKVDEISDVSGEDSSSENGEADEVEEKKSVNHNGLTSDRLIVSTELIDVQSKTKNKHKKLASVDDDDLDPLAGDGDNLSDEDDEDAEQRRLMSEAFAHDDVVGEFKKTKDQMADEEQPKDIDTFLPGWGDWAGPGIKVNKHKRKKYIIKAKKIARKDEKLGNVIISERANEVIKDLQPKQLPRGIKNDKHLRSVLTKPTTSTFLSQAAHRERVMPKLETRMGRRIEPISKDRLHGSGRKAEWT